MHTIAYTNNQESASRDKLSHKFLELQCSSTLQCTGIISVPVHDIAVICVFPLCMQLEKETKLQLVQVNLHGEADLSLSIVFLCLGNTELSIKDVHVFHSMAPNNIYG